jgi:hypothetical protein
MKPELTQRHCAVRECGAIVMIGEVDGRVMPLNPTWIDVVVATPEGGLTLTRGLQPHAATCVDISARVKHHILPAGA